MGRVSSTLFSLWRGSRRTRAPRRRDSDTQIGSKWAVIIYGITCFLVVLLWYRRKATILKGRGDPDPQSLEELATALGGTVGGTSSIERAAGKLQFLAIIGTLIASTQVPPLHLSQGAALPYEAGGTVMLISALTVFYLLPGSRRSWARFPLSFVAFVGAEAALLSTWFLR
jgi:hypothetical protein